MPALFEVTNDQIERLNDIQLTQILRKLLFLETQKFEIESNCAHVALNINVGDGGEDGRINWSNSATHTDFIPNSNTLFQCKATSMGPAGYADEIIDSSGEELKARVKQTWEQNGCYLVFTTQLLNGIQITDRKNKIRVKLASLSKSYSESCEIEIYDASKITTWVNCYYPAVITVLAYVNATSVNGLKAYDFWSQDRDIVEYEYVDIESRKPIIDDIRKSIKAGTRSIRVQGVSGLGKTRLAHQVFKNDEQLQNRLIYLDDESVTDSVALVAEWVNQNLSGVVVVDNCDYKTHNQLSREASRDGSQIQIITLDYTLDKVEASTNVYILEPLSTDEISSILTLYYDKTIKPGDLRRIAEFAQGFPQMAVLLARARLNNADNLGELDDDHIVEKLLWGRNRVINEKHLKVLQVCALFDWFGVENQRESDLSYISKTAGVDEDEAYEYIQSYTGKIINKGGDFRQVVPKPLAIRLASQWWNKSRTINQTKLIETIPPELERSFCSQISKMDTLPSVKDLAENLCGPQAPFGQAEVILSNKGSRFFRSLVEVNPKVTVQSLYRIVITLDDESIELITGGVRRNLIWALEMLVFHKSYFDKAAWCLFKFAQFENEKISNNATGQFIQLFRWQLSGTQADFTSRLALLNAILKLQDIKADLLVVKAINGALGSYGGSRTVGAEHQGTKSELEEWRPKIWQEIFDYWDMLGEILLTLSHKQEMLDAVKNAIGTNIRSLVRAGRIEFLDRSINYIIDNFGKYWPEASQSVVHVLTYDFKGLPEQAKIAVTRWECLFQPDKNNLEERLKLIVLNPSREHVKDDNGNYIDVGAEEAKKLAVELKDNLADLIQQFDLLMTFPEQKQSWFFAKNIVLESDSYNLLLEELLDYFRNNKKVNTQFFAGVLSGLYAKNSNKWLEVTEEIGADEHLVHYYPSSIRTGKIELSHLNTLIKLIKKNQLPSSSASTLAYGSVTEHLTEHEIAQFCMSLSEVDPTAVWVALDNINMYMHGRIDIDFNVLTPVLAHLVLNVSFKKEDKTGHSVSYHWLDSVEILLKTANKEFALKLCLNLINQVGNNDIDYSDLWDYLSDAFYKAFELHGNFIWPNVADRFLDGDVIKPYLLIDLLGSGKSYKERHSSIFDVLDMDMIIEWCRDEVGLLIVGRAISMFISNGDNRIINPLMVRLLSEFSDNKAFVSEISANFSSRSWSGSLVPYLDEDRKLLQPLVEHENTKVRIWVSNFIEHIDHQIEYETKKDLERKIRKF
jgi:hypothetical protein